MNDLIGLRYGWGHCPGDGSGLTDCFQLVCEVRRRLGLSDYADRFAWVYERWGDEDFPRSLVIRWLLKHGRRLAVPCFGAVALLPGDRGAALGSWLDEDMLWISPGQNVVRARVPAGIGRYFWMER